METISESRKSDWSLSEIKELVSKLAAGEYGKWKPVSAQRGVQSEYLEGVSRSLLGSMRPPIDCTYLSLFAANNRNKLEGNKFDEFVREGSRSFSLKSRAECSYKLIFQMSDCCYDIEIKMPAAGAAGEVRLWSDRKLPREVKSKLFHLVSLSDHLVESEDFVLDVRNTEDLEVVSLRDPSENGEEIRIRHANLETALADFSEELQASELIKDLSIFSFDCTVGYMDLDEIIAPADIVDLFAEIAEGTRFDSFDFDSRRTFSSDWNVREERRAQTSGDRPFLDQLGKLSDGEVTVDVGVLYGADGYGISVIGTENIQSQESPLLKFCEDARLTV